MGVITTGLGFLFAIPLLSCVLFLVGLHAVLGNQHLFDWLIKALCRAVPAVFGIQVRTSGRSRLASGQARLYLANHVNIFDPVILYGYIPEFVRAVELDKHFQWPLWGPIIKHSGMIPISHSQPRKAVRSLQLAAAAIETGTSMIILPEGHRTRDGNPGTFMKGPFRLARSVGADIVPVGLNGLYQRKRVNSLRVRPGRMTVRFGEPVAAQQVEEMSEIELRETIRSRILSLLDPQPG